jgi:hypothetical protein
MADIIEFRSRKRVKDEQLDAHLDKLMSLYLELERLHREINHEKQVIKMLTNGENDEKTP